MHYINAYLQYIYIIFIYMYIYNVFLMLGITCVLQDQLEAFFTLFFCLNSTGFGRTFSSIEWVGS